MPSNAIRGQSNAIRCHHDLYDGSVPSLTFVLTHRSAQVLALPKNLAAEMALQGRLKKGGPEGGKGDAGSGKGSGEASGDVALADGILSAWQAEGVSKTDEEIDAIQREIDDLEDTL